MNLENFFAGKLFISDLGEMPADAEHEEPAVRYAVWAPVNGMERHQIVEVGGHIEELMIKYGIPAENICVLA